MDRVEIRITAEPIDTARCKFLVSAPVHAGGVRRFSGAEEAKGSPLVEAIFAIPGAEVTEVIVSGNLVTVVKRSPAPWQVIGKSVGAAIRAALATDQPAIASKPAGAPAAPAAGGLDADADDGLCGSGAPAAARPHRRVRAAQHLRTGPARPAPDARFLESGASRRAGGCLRAGPPDRRRRRRGRYRRDRGGGDRGALGARG